MPEGRLQRTRENDPETASGKRVGRIYGNTIHGSVCPIEVLVDQSCIIRDNTIVTDEPDEPTADTPWGI